MNSHSPLGHGNGNNALIPERITSFSSPVVHAAAGKDFSLAVTEDNVVYGWGQGIQFLSHNPSSLPKSLS